NIWGMISGDANASGLIDILDKEPNWLLETGNSGYLNSDLNLDYQINNIDKNDNWVPNLGKGSLVPE
ncbi:MAG: hypothetical protein K8R74_13725, partial [Bacteroidales bacterium]|nr:hypothetical protein [Bacteroidales bacterium]